MLICGIAQLPMDRAYYLGLAAAGLRMAIGTDLVLHEQPDAEAVLVNGRRLGAVVQEAARRYGVPLALPLMDLRLEKADLLAILGVPEGELDTFHFAEPPGEAAPGVLERAADAPFRDRSRAHIDALRYIAGETSLVPVGMAIGPFSLMTKLLADPIAAIAMAGMGISAGEDESVLAAERCLRLAEVAVRRSVFAQCRAGARAMLICEPAANVVYLSPRQIEKGANIFERFVMQPNLRLRAVLDAAGVDLIFHDCGELNPTMVAQFARRLHPVILSLGSSRRLWEDAALVPKDVVLFGNLPTKSFYSDAAITLERVEELTIDLIARMRAAGHPHIPGSECDVLHVPEAAAAIRRKLDRMLACGRK